MDSRPKARQRRLRSGSHGQGRRDTEQAAASGWSCVPHRRSERVRARVGPRALHLDRAGLVDVARQFRTSREARTLR